MMKGKTLYYGGLAYVEHVTLGELFPTAQEGHKGRVWTAHVRDRRGSSFEYIGYFGTLCEALSSIREELDNINKDDCEIIPGPDYREAIHRQWEQSAENDRSTYHGRANFKEQT